MARILESGEDPAIYTSRYPDIPNEPGYLTFLTTIISLGTVGSEFYMTKGHHHRESAELYIGLSGQGMMIMDPAGGGGTSPSRSWCHRRRSMSPGVGPSAVYTGSAPLTPLAAFFGDAGHEHSSMERKAASPYGSIGRRARGCTGRQLGTRRGLPCDPLLSRAGDRLAPWWPTVLTGASHRARARYGVPGSGLPTAALNAANGGGSTVGNLLEGTPRWPRSPSPVGPRRAGKSRSWPRRTSRASSGGARRSLADDRGHGRGARVRYGQREQRQRRRRALPLSGLEAQRAGGRAGPPWARGVPRDQARAVEIGYG